MKTTTIILICFIIACILVFKKAKSLLKAIKLSSKKEKNSLNKLKFEIKKLHQDELQLKVEEKKLKENINMEIKRYTDENEIKTDKKIDNKKIDYEKLQSKTRQNIKTVSVIKKIIENKIKS